MTDFDFDKYADEMHTAAEGLRGERHTLAAELDELDDRLRRLDTAIRALNGQLPKSAPARAGRKTATEQTKAAVLQALRDNGPEIKQSDVAQLAGVSKNTAARTLAQLAEEGKARRVDLEAAGGTPRLWELVH